MRILVPTDFSELANFAYDLALKIAGLTEGSVHLFHCMEFPEKWEGMKESDTQLYQLANESKSEVSRLLEELVEKGNRFEVDVDFQVTSWRFFKRLREAVKDEKIDLVIMGSHGQSGISEWYIGSNAQKVVRALHANVLVIKNEAQDIDLKKVLFATDLKSKDKLALKSFVEFLKPFNPEEIHILAIDTMGYFNQPTVIMEEALREFEESVTEIPCKSHFYKEISVQRGIRKFSEEHDISLIAISNYERHPVKRIFQGSNVEMLINHSAIPVLALDKE